MHDMDKKGKFDGCVPIAFVCICQIFKLNFG